MSLLTHYQPPFLSQHHSEIKHLTSPGLSLAPAVGHQQDLAVRSPTKTVEIDPFKQLGQLEFLNDERRVELSNGEKRLRVTVLYHDDVDNVIVEAQITRRRESRHRNLKSDRKVVLLMGCSEVPYNATGKAMGDGLARRNDDADIITFATDGMSRHGTRFSFQELLFERTFQAQGESRLRALEALTAGSDEPVDFVTESMNATTVQHLIKANMVRPVVNIDRAVNHSDGIVTREESFRRILQFPGHIIADSIREATHHPFTVSKYLLERVELLHPRALQTMAAEVILLAQGIDYDLLNEVAEGPHRQGFIAGDLDPLHQPYVLSQLQNDHPNTVVYRPTPGGHANALDGNRTARHITNMFAALDELPH